MTPKEARDWAKFNNGPAANAAPQDVMAANAANAEERVFVENWLCGMYQAEQEGINPIFEYFTGGVPGGIARDKSKQMHEDIMSLWAKLGINVHLWKSAEGWWSVCPNSNKDLQEIQKILVTNQ